MSQPLHPFTATVYPSSNGYFQQDNASHHTKQKVVSKLVFNELDNEFSVFLNTFWDVVERESLMQLCQHGKKNLESVPQRTERLY